jgi:hypothetical protein
MSPTKKSPPPKPAPRADYGQPIDAFFGKQPAPLQPLLRELRKMVEAAAPDATSQIKWGMPFYEIGGNMMCALGGHKSHVNLVLHGPSAQYVDPKGLLAGESKLGRHLKLRAGDTIPKAEVKKWLTVAAKKARGG